MSYNKGNFYHEDGKQVLDGVTLNGVEFDDAVALPNGSKIDGANFMKLNVVPTTETAAPGTICVSVTEGGEVGLYIQEGTATEPSWRKASEGSVTTYSITNNLTNCTNSNTSHSIVAEQPYSGTITADEGYSLVGGTVSITMGGVDVTASVYNNGVITIASVTGDIVISIAAVEIPPQPLPIEYFIFDTGPGSGAGLDGVWIAGFSTAGQTAYDNNEITALILPDNDGQGNNVVGLGSASFYGLTKITSAVIPNSVIMIAQSAFSGCSGLTSITIPNSVDYIQQDAFHGCTGLTSAIIGSGVTSIGEYAFQYCPSLTSITIEATTPPILYGQSIFDDTNNCPIYVPSASVVDYQSATNWTKYASRIQAKPEA